MRRDRVVVIGGGAAGMMAAGRAAEAGGSVLLVEKNRKLGQKLLLTGKGRCNLTQAEFDIHEFVSNLGKRGDFMYSPLSRFGVRETMEFFEKKGLELKVERGKRVFPKSGKAEDVVSFFRDYLKKEGVEVERGCRVRKVNKRGRRVTGLDTEKGGIKGARFIIATGGKSYPGTGSTGDGFVWSRELGHTVTKTYPCLVPLKTKEEWVKQVQGLDLKNVNLTLFFEGEEKEQVFGDMIFTHFGVSGPIVLEASRKAVPLLEKGRVEMGIDLKPALDFEKLDRRVIRDFKKYHRSLFKNSLKDLLPSKIIPLIVEKSGIEERKPVHQITREQRHKLVRVLKDLRLTVEEPLGFDQAVVTKGGVLTDQVSQKTMRSKKIKNLYFAGEVLDLDGPTGGYNLQIAWTTGCIAGESSAR